MSDMILTFLLPLFVWHKSFSATDLLESCTATDPLVKVAAMGVPVIIAAIVVVAFLAIMFPNSNRIRALRSSRLVVTSVVVAMAALVSIVVSFVVTSVVVAMAALVSIVVSFVVVMAVVAPVVWLAMDPSVVVAATSVPVVVLSAMMVVGGVPTMALAMAAGCGVLAMVVSSIVAVAMCVPVSIATLFFVVLPIFGDAPDCSGTTVVVATEPFFFPFGFDFVIPCLWWLR